MSVVTQSPLELAEIRTSSDRSRRRSLFPLTVRGVALLIFAGYLLVGPVARETDIVAAVFATTLIFVVIALLGLTVTSGTRLRREFDLTLSFPEDDETGASGTGAYSGSEVGCLMKIPALSIWPLYVLSVRLVFEEGELELPLHRITGSFEGPTLLPQPITFPHRGRWRLHEIECVFGDQFGLSQLRWINAIDQTHATLTVRPPRPRDEPSLPVITSCQRSGDLVTDLHDRRGDLFDLKPYHPSDGMRRIVWKIFARRGELVARQPEASMTPEGQAVLFCLANAEEDHVCGAALSYVDDLDRLGIDIFFGTAGIGDRTPARSPVEAERLTIDTVWGTKRLEPHALLMEVDGVAGAARKILGPTATIDRILIVCSAERIGIPGQAEALLSLAHHLEAQRIKPVFFVLETQQPRMAAPMEGVWRWFTLPTPRTSFEPSNRADFERFAAIAGRAGWEMIRFGGSA